MPDTSVIIGCDSHPDYSMLLPVTCALWRDLVGYHPIAVLVGSEDEWRADGCAAACLDALREIGIEHRFVAPVDGYRTSTTAQNIRLHMPADPTFATDEWIMMADADIWPLLAGNYRGHEARPESLVVYGEHFIDKRDVLHGWAADVNFAGLPSFNWSMRARTWRDVYQYQCTDPRESLRMTLDRELRPRTTGKSGPDANSAAWHFDQYYTAARICAQDWYPAGLALLRRNERRGHLVPWHVGLGWDADPRTLTDVHIRHGIYAERRFEALMPVIERVLPVAVPWARDLFEKVHRAWEATL